MTMGSSYLLSTRRPPAHHRCSLDRFSVPRRLPKAQNDQRQVIQNEATLPLIPCSFRRVTVGLTIARVEVDMSKHQTNDPLFVTNSNHPLGQSSCGGISSCIPPKDARSDLDRCPSETSGYSYFWDSVVLISNVGFLLLLLLPLRRTVARRLRETIRGIDA